MTYESSLPESSVLTPGSLCGQMDRRAVFGDTLTGNFGEPHTSRTARETAEKAMAEEETRHVSLETQNALYRSILSSYGNGLADKGAMAQFALDHPDQATRALEAYHAQQQLVLEMTQEFLLSNSDNTNALQREMDRLLRMRGTHSRPQSGVVDARGSRRRKR